MAIDNGFTRPADTTAYTVGDLVANSTTAGSVVAMVFNGLADYSIRRCRLYKSGTTNTLAAFRVHLFYVLPTPPTNGDNGAFVPAGTAGYLGALDVFSMVAGTDGCNGTGAPVVGSEINLRVAAGQTIYALLEARAGYTPGNAESFVLQLETLPNP